MRRIIPEWERKHLCLISPYSSECEYKYFDELIDGMNELFNTEVISGTGCRDIWVRDWGPLPAEDESGRFFMKFKYMPSYLNKNEALPDDLAGYTLAKRYSGIVEKMGIKWDMGNITVDGQGNAICTSRILKDNCPKYSEGEIRAILQFYAGIDNLIIVDEEPGDMFGHIDGSARFIDTRTIAVGDYPDACGDMKSHMDRMERDIRNGMGNSCKIIRIMNECPDRGYSAYGNRMNFIRIDRQMILPSYGTERDDEAKNTIRQACPSLDIGQVNVSSMDFVKAGGVLNCITWSF